MLTRSPRAPLSVSRRARTPQGDRNRLYIWLRTPALRISETSKDASRLETVNGLST